VSGVGESKRAEVRRREEGWIFEVGDIKSTKMRVSGYHRGRGRRRNEMEMGRGRGGGGGYHAVRLSTSSLSIYRQHTHPQNPNNPKLQPKNFHTPKIHKTQ
jgi:hypothetical protein